MLTLVHLRVTPQSQLMKYFLFSLLFLLPATSFAQSQTDIIQQKWIQIAQQYGADRGVGFVIIVAESQYNPQAIGDHGLAHGLVQIREDFHPNISLDEMTDIDFSLNFLAQALVAGKCNQMFSTCPLAKSLNM